MTDQSAHPLRDQLTFEQQARYDALLTHRTKKTGTASMLALPLLGTFGLEHFYLGNPIRGVVSVLFSWTLIPTVSALFDLATGDIKRQVAHANTRSAKAVYAEVIRYTPPLAQTPVAPVIPPVAAMPVAAVAPVAAPAIAVTNVAITTAPDAPAVTVSDVQVTQQQEQVTQVSEASSSTVTTSHWQPGMNAPQTDSVTEAAAANVVSAAVATTTTETVTAAVATGDAPTLTTATIGEYSPAVAAFDLTPGQIEADAQPLAASDALAADGVLVFVEDPSPLTADSVASRAMPTLDAVTVDQVATTATQHVTTETAQTSEQHYHDGQLIASDAAGVSLNSEFNTLLTDHAQATLLATTEAPASPSAPWVDVSPLHSQAALHLDAANLPASDAGLGQTNAPGGAIGDGTNPTNTPGGGLGDPKSADPESMGHRPGPIAE